MEIQAIYRGHTEAVEGVNKQGQPWRKMTAIFDIMGDHPKTIAFDAMNSTCESVLTLVAGRLYRVCFDLDSREFNGKWYTNARAWAFIGLATEQPKQAPKPQPVVELPPIGSSSNDLPF